SRNFAFEIPDLNWWKVPYRVPGQLNSRETTRDTKPREEQGMATIRLLVIGNLTIAFFLSGCSTPTLVQIARRRLATDENRQSSRNVKDDVRVIYHVADVDVLNFTDEVKRKLANRSSFHMGVQYGSAGTQATLGALAGAAEI